MDHNVPEATRVLIVGAHPDDPDFACGGAVARWADAGAAVWYVVVTSGDKGTTDSTGDTTAFCLQREQEQQDSARYLGVEGVTFLRLTDGEVFDTLELRGQITAEIRRFKPDLIVTHDPLTRHYRQHADHRAVGFATLHAAFPSSRLMTFFPEQAEAGFGPHLVQRALLFATDRPGIFVDIAPVFERKLAALKLHASQTDAFPGGLFDRLRLRSQEAGAQVGLELAEAYLAVDL